jgi:choline kinase
MRAIILAAGIGGRLGNSTTEHPKCLLQLEGRTLLDRMLDALEAVDIREIVVVIGYLEEQIREAVAGREGVSTIFNPEYRKGAIVSLWCAREHFDDDLLVMDADVLFPTELLRRLVECREENCFLMDTSAESDGEAQMLMARSGRAVDIARGLRGEYDTCGESIGFLKLNREGAAVLAQLMEDALGAGRTGIEHEDLYPDLMRKCPIGYVTTDGMPWTEIDFAEDVERARRMLRRQ